MDKSDVIKLIKVTNTKDSTGVPRTVYGEPRTVMCQVDSVTRAEFFEGGRNGLNPEFVFRVFFGDYDGERLLEYNGKRYGIYRTYHGRGDQIELYVERKGGTNGNGN
jgi:SPP1 family predicted phage head-tail adaptor